MLSKRGELITQRADQEKEGGRGIKLKRRDILQPKRGQNRSKRKRRTGIERQGFTQKNAEGGGKL